MFGLGFGELVVILVVVVLVFGANRIPELGTALGEGIKNFKKGYREAKSIDISPQQDSAAPHMTTPSSSVNNPTANSPEPKG